MPGVGGGERIINFNKKLVQIQDTDRGIMKSYNAVCTRVRGGE